MTKTKLCSVFASIMLAFTLGLSGVIAAEDEGEAQYLPDVENLAGTAIPGGATLSWGAVDGADLYTIYYGTQSVQEDGGSYAEQVLVEEVTTHDITDLVVGTTYYFAVAADDSTGAYLGSYNYSDEVTVTVIEAAAEPEPEPIVAEDPVVEDHEAAAEPEPEPIVEPEPVIEPEPVVEAEPESLPQSGPLAGVLVLASAAGAYVWRKKFSK